MYMADQPLVSVVVTTKNEEKNIANCLQSVVDQTYPRESVEIIVVDNNSSDRTKEIARQYTEQVFDKGPERSAQRNFGISGSRGEYALYLDADMIMGPGVILDCVTRCEEDKNLQALYVPEIVMGESFWCKVRRFERGFYDGTVIDCVRFVRRSAFDMVGGFDESMTGPEDWDFDKKIRALGKVSLASAAIQHNESDFDLKKYLKKKSYYAKSFDGYIKKWGKDDPDIIKQLGLQYRFLVVYLENGKWRRMVTHPILVLAMYFLRFRVGLSFLKRAKV